MLMSPLSAGTAAHSGDSGSTGRGSEAAIGFSQSRQTSMLQQAREALALRKAGFTFASRFGIG